MYRDRKQISGYLELGTRVGIDCNQARGSFLVMEMFEN